MRFSVHTAGVAAAIVFALAGFEYFSRHEYRIGPGTLALIGLLLTARYVVQLQIQKRKRLVQEVPKRPLGLDV